MIPYLVLLFLVTTVAYIGRQSQYIQFQRLSLFIVAVGLILFAGLRDYGIGTDTWNYYRIWNNARSLGDVLSSNIEIGYMLLVWLTHKLFDSYSILLIATAIIAVILYLSTIIRFIENYEFGIYLFIVFGFYTAFFNAARQSIAVAICFWALPFLFEKRFIPYAVCIFVAMLFHKTAIIALPIYFLASPEIRLRRIIGLLASVVVFTLFIRIFVGFASEFLDDRYVAYAVHSQSGGVIDILVLFLEIIILFLLRHRIKKNIVEYNMLLNIYLISLVPSFVTLFAGVDPSGLLRLSRYFSGVEMLLWPIVFYEIKKTKQTMLIGFSFLIVSLAYFTMTTSTWSNLTPYAVTKGLFW